MKKYKMKCFQGLSKETYKERRLLIKLLHLRIGKYGHILFKNMANRLNH